MAAKSDQPTPPVWRRGGLGRGQHGELIGPRSEKNAESEAVKIRLGGRARATSFSAIATYPLGVYGRFGDLGLYWLWIIA